MLAVLQRVIEKVISSITGFMQRALVFLSLAIVFVSCIGFLYGLYTHSSFYCLFSVIGALSFVYVNKQT